MFQFFTILVQLLFHYCICQETFNIDLKFPILIKTIESDSNNHLSLPIFSSLVATSQANEHKIFIGSPNFVSNDSFISGAVFECPFQLQSIKCHPNFDGLIQGINNPNQYKSSNKSLYGMTIQVTDNYLIVCSPNWVGLDETSEGVCFLHDKFSFQQKMILKYPRDTLVKMNRPYESHNLFGFSIDFNRRTGDLLFGLPGFRDFTGALSTVKSDFQFQKIKMEKMKSLTNSYTGYSVSFFSFDGNDALLATTPKYNYFKGKVDLIDTSTHTIMQTLFSKDDTNGEFFGASLLVVDIENDLNNEILVGAPFYSISPKQREVGRVYLFKDVKKSLLNDRYNHEVILPQNRKTGSRFGTNIASIDLNRDSFNDIIISSPFEENDDRSSTGAIYIYYGSWNGLNTDVEKRIGAESIAQKNIIGFGYSLWTKTDFDSNGYSDLIIGSLTTGKAFILRTYPIINISASMTFQPKGINYSDTSLCTTHQRPCFKVSYCIDLDSNWFDFSENELSFDVRLSITDRKLDLKEKRVLNDKSNQIIKTQSNRYCSNNDSFYVELKGKDDVFDILTPIEVQLSVTLRTSETNTFCPTCPVANSLTIYDEIGFEHGCAHQYCLSQLVLSVDIKYGSISVDQNIVEGQYTSLDINAILTNQGELSINTQMFIILNPVHLNLIPNSDSSRCTSMDADNGFKCEINKFMLAKQKEEIILRLDLQSIETRYLSLDFEIKTSSQVQDGSQLSYSKNITIKKEADFMMKMRLENHYNFTDFIHKVLFPVSIVIEKSGPSNVDGTYLQFELPWMIEMEQPFQFRCNKIKQGSDRLTKFDVINDTLKITCTDPSSGCSMYRCKLNRFESGTRLKNFDITLSYISTRIKSTTKYKRAFLETLFQLYSNDSFFTHSSLFINLDKPFDEIKPLFYFYKQDSEKNDKFKNAIIFGSAGLGILFIILTIIILIKYGFFKRKKLEELKRVKQRMSMNPNMFPIPMMDQNVNEINQIGYS